MLQVGPYLFAGQLEEILRLISILDLPHVPVYVFSGVNVVLNLNVLSNGTIISSTWYGSLKTSLAIINADVKLENILK